MYGTGRISPQRPFSVGRKMNIAPKGTSSVGVIIFEETRYDDKRIMI